MPETFQDRFCRHFHMPPERFAAELLRRALYPRARLLRGVIWLFDHGHFAPDEQFVAGVGRLTQRRDFFSELKDYHVHPENQSFLRSQLRMRISANRMSKIFFEVWANDPAAAADAPDLSEAPFTGRTPRADSTDAPSHPA
jgi:hypothetical protein